MQRKELLTTLFLLAVAVAQSSASSQEPASTRLHVPSTISDEARAYLSCLKTWEERLSEAKPLKTQSDWDDAWSKSEERFVEVNRKVRDRYIPCLEQKKIANIDVFIFTPKDYNPANDGKALLYVHGGAYVFGSPKGSVFLHGPIAFYTGLKVYALKYRLAPRDPYPAGLDDCVAVYRAMVDEYGATKLGVFGHSAGGSLLLSMLLKARDQHGTAMPAAVASITPWSDLAKVGDTYYTLEGIAPVLHYDILGAAARAYAGEADMKEPLVSPVYGDYSKGFAPTLIQTGTRDLFLSNCVRLHREMKRSGVAAELSVFEGMWHGFQGIPNPFFPEAVEANKETAAFLARHLQVSIQQ